eukprot:403339269
MLGNFHNYSWNKKLCFEARDSLYDCVDSQDNGNKYRCPDQLYAYEMWCPPDFRTIHSNQRRQQIRESEMYSKEWVDKVNKEHQTIDTRKYTRT